LSIHHSLGNWLTIISLGVAAAASVQAETALAETAPVATTRTVQLVAGTYNTSGSEGIYGIAYDLNSGQFGEPKLLAKADNPSWITVAGKRVYVANELDKGALTTYALGGDGSLTPLGSTPTNGAAPCYVAVSPDQKFVATANYMGGNVSIFALDDKGVAQKGPQILQNEGKGPNIKRQEAPHAHWVQWDKQQKFIYNVDLGIDEVRVSPFDSKTGKAGAGKTAFKLQPGDGPRHMHFHPTKPLAYIVNELSNTLVVVEQASDGTLKQIQRTSTLPTDFKEHNQVAHLYVTRDGKNLYVSNRGHQSIAVFAIAETGLVTLLETEPVQGDWPRHFMVLEEEKTLIVANQKSFNLIGFKIAADGTLAPTGERLALPQTTFLGQLY
jgi:6-phosphogluconolactonase